MRSLTCSYNKHFDYYAKIVSNIQDMANLGGENYILSLKKFEQESQNINIAYTWIAKASIDNYINAKKCCNFILESRPFLINFVPYRRFEWLEVAYRASLFINDRVFQLRILLEMGSSQWFLGNYDYAVQFYAKVIDYYQIEFNKDILATAYGLMGQVKSDTGDYKEAIEYLKKALDIFVDEKQRSIYLLLLGQCYFSIGDKETALSVYKESLFLAHKVGDLRGKADILGNFGLLYERLRLNTKSLNLYNLALKLAKQVYDQRGESNQLINLANLHRRIGKNLEAEVYSNKALILCSQNQNLKGMLKCNLILCRCAWRKVDLSSTVRYAIKVHNLLKQLNFTSNFKKLFQYVLEYFI